MTITEIKADCVFATIQKLTSGQQLIACDFKRGEMRDTSGLTVERISQLISEGTTKFYKTEATA